MGGGEKVGLKRFFIHADTVVRNGNGDDIGVSADVYPQVPMFGGLLKNTVQNGVFNQRLQYDFDNLAFSRVLI